MKRVGRSMGSHLPAAVATTGSHPIGAYIESRAAATVRKWVTDPAEADEVLQMLGLDHVPDPADGVRQAYAALAHAITAPETP